MQLVYDGRVIRLLFILFFATCISLYSLFDPILAPSFAQQCGKLGIPCASDGDCQDGTDACKSYVCFAPHAGGGSATCVFGSNIAPGTGLGGQQATSAASQTQPPPPPPCSKGLDASGKETTDKEFIVKCTEVATGLGISLGTDPSSFVKTFFGIILSLSGGIALLLIMVSGYQLMFSQGNPEKTQGAKETLTSTIVGLLFIIFSLVILQVVGVDILCIPGFESFKKC